MRIHCKTDGPDSRNSSKGLVNGSEVLTLGITQHQSYAVLHVSKGIVANNAPSPSVVDELVMAVSVWLCCSIAGHHSSVAGHRSSVAVIVIVTASLSFVTYLIAGLARRVESMADSHVTKSGCGGHEAEAEECSMGALLARAGETVRQARRCVATGPGCYDGVTAPEWRRVEVVAMDLCAGEVVVMGPMET
ncbi:hypothetical protein EDB85DRAFT_1896657 [Lactarius pseudohatsudake]|nr:hypothetical protein EDB85DRAFT_1896657 [Lactarius pseudohatsudake]